MKAVFRKKIELAILLMCVILPVYFFKHSYSILTAKVYFFAAFVAVVFIVAAVKNMTSSRHFEMEKGSLFFISFFFVCVCSTFANSGHVDGTILIYSSLVLFMYFLSGDFIRDKEKLVLFLVLSAIIPAGYFIISLFLKAVSDDLSIIGGVGNLIGKRDDIGVFSLMIIPLSAYLITLKKWRVYAFISLSLCTSAVVLTADIPMVTSLVLAFFVWMFWAGVKIFKTRKVLYSALLVFAVVISFFLSLNAIKDKRIIKGFYKGFERFYVHKKTGYEIHILGGVTGNGRLGVARNYLSVYQKAFGVSRHSEGGVSDFISGTFLQAGIEAGSVGLFLFIMFFVMIIKRSFKEALAEKGKSLGCYIIFSLVFFSIYSVFTYTFSNVSLLFVFFLLAFFPAKTDRNKIMLSSKLLLLPLVIAGFLLAFAALNFYSEAASKMARAASLQNLKNKKRILLMYETSLFANPYNQYALEGYSGYLYKAGEYKKSCVYFSRLLKIRTEIKDLYLYALCLVKTGELNAALKLADKMLVLHGRGYEGYVIKGIISASSNDIQKAVYYFSRSIQNGASPVLAEKHLGKYFDAVYKNWLKGFLGK